MNLYILTLLLIAVLSITSCNNSSSKESNQISNVLLAAGEQNETPDINVADTNVESQGCKADDILLLKSNKDLFNSFFDNVEKWYLDNDISINMDDSVFVSITKPLFNTFLADLDEKEFVRNMEFSKVYEFDKFPSEYANGRSCEDIIYLHFSEDECLYILGVNNSFYIEDFGCSEQGVVYQFKILDDKITVIRVDIVG